MWTRNSNKDPERESRSLRHFDSVDEASSEKSRIDKF